ncbi:DNA recombination protein RmuC [Candidatus Lariskella endosymbiont of Epinotia ramella]|uniref:DNA recombination protein RmuC n=1 Tax=Candidatus Lariskella endosymbiont of Epinotia ramella TaxID=3066224 RepID=UPI0030D24DBB
METIIIALASLFFVLLSQFFVYRKVSIFAGRSGALEELTKQITELTYLSVSNKTQIESLQSHISEQLKVSRDIQQEQLKFISDALEKLKTANDLHADRMRQTVDSKLLDIQHSNDKKLEEMRKTVDEKLHSTLEQRLNQSFKLVSDKLEMLHKGLGQMQSISSQVVDLKNILSNVKTRGIWGEVQLKSIIEQIMTPEQYLENINVIPGSQERVEYAVRLPGRDNSGDILLPIDAKFPLEDYQRLIEAQKTGDVNRIKEYASNLKKVVKKQAKTISEKYIKDPYTTDFAIMFMATEGLYAEVLQEPGIVEELQSSYRVIIAGPATISAMLSSLKMGFKTLAIERKSKELWALLAPLKSQFNNFGTLLGKTRLKLEQATETIVKVENETRKIQNNFQNIESSSAANVVELDVEHLPSI